MSFKNKLFVWIFFCFFSLSLHAFAEDVAAEPPNEPSILFGLIIEDSDNLIPSFLKNIEKIDYDKKFISVQINNCNSSPQVKELVEKWAAKNEKSYKRVVYVDNAPKSGKPAPKHLTAEIKDSFLAQTLQQHCDYCFITQSGIFLAPSSLKTLISENKPIISPLLRPIPEQGDPFRNFFADVTESGYFKFHPDYSKIANREMIGSFKVPCVHGVYLIKAPYINQLKFNDPAAEWEFIAFSKNARENNVEQYICNTKEFGSLLHFNSEMSKEDIRAYSLVNEEAEVTPQLLQNWLVPYMARDLILRKHIANFDFDKYFIYRVENRDLFYIDEDATDKVSLAIKNGTYPSEPSYNEIHSHTREGGKVIAVGGNGSPLLLDFSELVGTDGRVYVFESNPKAFTELVINNALNQCKNVKFYRSDATGQTKQRGNVPNGETLDSLQLENISFVRIDANGQEMKVIEGALKTILRDKPTLLIRIAQGATDQKTIASIENLGYNHYGTSAPDMHLFVSTQADDAKLYNKNVTIAILAKDKAHILPLYLKCIEMQNWPASKTNLYIRTNNNNDATAQILRDWVARVRDRYATVHFDDSDVPERVQDYKQHEWNSVRFKVLGKIRQDSVDWAKDHDSHYFVVDCDNFVHPDTLSAMVRTNLPIVAPFLRAADTSFYANYHAAIDAQGYMANSPFYYSVLNRDFKGLVDLPVVHCSYFIRHNVLDKIVYDDESGRYEYVIFSDVARKMNIPQYLDNRRLYGRLTFAESGDDISKEGWMSEFWYTK